MVFEEFPHFRFGHATSLKATTLPSAGMPPVSESSRSPSALKARACSARRRSRMYVRRTRLSMTWFRHSSITSPLMPSSAMMVAAVRRRSCAVQRPPGSSSEVVLVDRPLMRRSGGRWRSESCLPKDLIQTGPSLARLGNSHGTVRPRASDWRKDAKVSTCRSAKSERWIVCSRSFLVTGRCQVRATVSTCSQRAPIASPTRTPVARISHTAA